MNEWRTLPKGIVTTSHTVWCCRSRRVMDGMPFESVSTVGSPQGCHSFFEHAGTAREATEEAKSQRWVQTKEFGWLCPNCVLGWKKWQGETKAKAV